MTVGLNAGQSRRYDARGWLLLVALLLPVVVVGAGLLTPRPAVGSPAECSVGVTLDQCQCPDGKKLSQIADSYVCEAPCAPGQRYDRNGDCVTPPPTCTGGMVPQNGSCACPAGTTLGPRGLKCIKSCPAGEQLAQDGSETCVKTQTSCPAGKTLAHGQCITLTCGGGSIPVNGVCTCPAGMTTTHNGGGTQCRQQCPAGQHLAGSGNCVANQLKCGPGTKPGPQGLKCVSVCAAGEHLAPDGSETCVKTQTSCPAGKTLAHGQCITLTCGGGSIPVNGVCTCPTGMTTTHNGGGTQCHARSCPAGQHLANGTCVANQSGNQPSTPLVCPPGTKPGPKGLRCIRG